MAKSKEETDREERERADAEKAKAAAPAPTPSKAQQSKADKARAAALGAKKYVMATASVGGHLKGTVVERDKIANFTGDIKRPATEDEVTAGIARLMDKGAIVPAPEDDDEEA